VEKTGFLRTQRGETFAGNFASNLVLGHRDASPLFSFLEDGSRLARNPVYLSRPINIGSSLGGKFSSASLPLRATAPRRCGVAWPWKSRLAVAKIKVPSSVPFVISFHPLVCLLRADGIVCVLIPLHLPARSANIHEGYWVDSLSYILCFFANANPVLFSIQDKSLITRECYSTLMGMSNKHVPRLIGSGELRFL